MKGVIERKDGERILRREKREDRRGKREEKRRKKQRKKHLRKVFGGIAVFAYLHVRVPRNTVRVADNTPPFNNKPRGSTLYLPFHLPARKLSTRRTWITILKYFLPER